MKTKKKNNFRAVILAVASLAVVSSCDSNDIDVFGSADLKVVNAAPNSGSQRFSLANIPEISDLEYLENSVGYLDVASGNNLVAEYRDQNDNDLYAKKEYDLDDNGHYTIYLTGESRDGADVRMYGDDLSVPSSGKAKVKFLHLSTGAPESIDFKDAEGTNLSSGLGRYAQSSYTEIAGGSISIEVSGPGETASFATLPAADFAAGKIYTVYISGATTSGYTVKKILHN